MRIDCAIDLNRRRWIMCNVSKKSILSTLLHTQIFSIDNGCRCCCCCCCFCCHCQTTLSIRYPHLFQSFECSKFFTIEIMIYECSQFFRIEKFLILRLLFMLEAIIWIFSSACLLDVAMKMPRWFNLIGRKMKTYHLMHRDAADQILNKIQAKSIVVQTAQRELKHINGAWFCCCCWCCLCYYYYFYSVNASSHLSLHLSLLFCAF